MNATTAIGLVLACSLPLGCDHKAGTPAANDGPSDAEVKELLSRAAGMPGEVFLKVVERGGIVRPSDLPERYLTAELLFMPPGKGRESSPDFQRTTQVPNPSALADALIGGRKPKEQIEYASIIWPAYVTELTSRRSGDDIVGSAAFEATDLYKGRVEFTLKRTRSDPGWKVTRLAVPGQNVSLELAEDGTWKTASQ